MRGFVSIARLGRTHDFTAGSAHVANCDEPFDLRVKDEVRALVANFDRELLASFVSRRNDGESRQDTEFAPRLPLEDSPGSRFWRYASFTWGELHRAPAILSSPLVARGIEDTLMAMLIEAADEQHSGRGAYTAAPCGPYYLRQAEEYLRARLKHPVSAADLAQAAGVSYRSLTRAFRERHGVSPMRFLKLRRMEATQRDLLGADPRNATVTRIATEYGFTHLGFFSIDYARLFQESPSETLRR